MDHSIVNLLEEDDKDDSKHSKDNLDLLQEALNRDTEGQLWENPLHVPQASDFKSVNKPIGNESERPQPQYMKLQEMSSQQAPGVEQCVHPINRGPRVGVCDLLRILIDQQPDKDRKRRFLTLYDKLKRKEITIQGFIQNLRDDVGDQMIRSVISQMHQLQPAQKPHSLVKQGVTNVPLEQNNAIPISSNDDLKKQSSKMVLSTSTVSASSVSPSMTTQLDSSTMVNLPAPSGTITKRASVRVTPKMPSVGQKKSLEALGSSPPRSSKKQKLCGTSSYGSIEKFNDVTAVSDINLQEEEKQLLGPEPKKNSRVSKASREVVHEEEERMILQKIPLQRKLTEIMAKSGFKHIDHDAERCLSLCVKERMRRLLSNIIRISKQRADAEKCRNGTYITSDFRKEINEMNQKVKEEWEKKHAEEEKVKNKENDAKKEDKRSKQVKEKKEEDQWRVKAANVAVHAAFGGDDTISKWKLMAKARQKSSPGPGRNSKKLSGETGGTKFGKNQGLPKVVRSISVKDVIAVLEKEPQMSRSTLLYCLYNRICSDV